ncbi:hypothetical protein GIB67_028803 [Kingdonia uniflora]|uniref:Uncharacterized protein n=1 Tax=Kingdonia uniflora TaxID=39325 RepID=A0A7J7LBC9_9MAGN|nr:hypothetical protein GIB67_028803 [Kingdonia uniflora]
MNQVQWLLDILAIIILYNEIVKLNRRIRQRLCTSAFTGKAYVQELLEGPRTLMYPVSFRSLVAHFKDNGLLRDSKYIDVKEKCHAPKYNNRYIHVCIQVNSEVKKYQTAPLQHKDLLDKLFEGLSATGDFLWSSGMGNVPSTQ